MKTYIGKFAIISSLILLFFLMNFKINAARPAAVSYNFTPTDEGWKNLSLREKIGLTMIMVADYQTQTTRFGSIENMMKQYPVGGLFIPAWIFGTYKPEAEIISNIQKCMREYDAASKIPLLITEDFERGVGGSYRGYTDLPVEMSLGAANNPTLSYQYGNAISKEASTLGVNWLLHPVTDLNKNPLQDLVVERAVSDDDKRAYPLLKAQINGMKAQGIVPTIKHFPGDGATMKNQHLITSANNLSMKEWNDTYGTLFQKMINDGIPCIMVGHLRFPAYQKEKLKGVLPPATLSSELMQGLLKKEMKFNGVIMSDALNMGGIGGYYSNALETMIASFKAGVDLILWPSFEYMDSVEVRIKRGEIPMSRLDDAVKRIWGVREKYGLLKKKNEICYTLTDADKATIKQTGISIAESAVTLLADVNKELPLLPSKDKKLIIINISHNNLTGRLKLTRELLQKQGFDVDTILHNPTWWAWQNKMKFFEKYDKVIVAFENRYLQPIGSSMLKDTEALGIWTVNMIPSEKVIAISYSNPYYVNFYNYEAPTRINAYSLDNFSQKAVVDAITGKIPFKGTTPVKLDQRTMQ